MNKLFSLFIFGLFISNYTFALNFPTNKEQSENCPIFFEYPDSLEVYIAPSEAFNSADTICRLVFIYKEKKETVPSIKTSGDGILEVSDVVIDVLKKSVEDRLEEYSFKKESDDHVIYIGQTPACENKIDCIKEFTSPIQIMEKEDDIKLYVGEAIISKISKRGKIRNSKRTDFLIGNKEKSAGLIFWESTRDQNSLGKSKIWMTVFKSMKIH